MTSALVLCLLAACSESENPSVAAATSLDSTDQIGFVGGKTSYLKSSGVLETRTSLGALFLQYESSLTSGEIADVTDRYANTRNVKKAIGCESDLWIVGGSLSESFSAYEPAQRLSERVSGGDSVTVSTAAGSWYDIPRKPGKESFPTIYYSNDKIPETIPVDAVADIPGDDFPQFEAIAIPDVDRLVNVQVTATEDDRVTAGSQITWDAAADSDDMVKIEFEVENVPVENPDDGNFVADYRFECYTEDTGEFSFSDSIGQLLDEHTMLTDAIRMTRIAQSTVQKGSALLYVTNAKVFEGFE